MDHKATPLSTRYSDEELHEFKKLFEQKLATAQNELLQLMGLLKAEEDNIKKEQLHQMIYRHHQFIDHLNNVLNQIEAKTYGICRETGKLIEKEKLLALPHGKINKD